jgi:hypothetical protein
MGKDFLTSKGKKDDYFVMRGQEHKIYKEEVIIDFRP